MAQKIRLEDRECPLSATLGLVGEVVGAPAHPARRLRRLLAPFDQFQENLGISSSLLTTRLKRMGGQGLSNGASTRQTRPATSTC